MFIHLEGIPHRGINPTGSASLSNVSLYVSLPPVISEEFTNSQSKGADAPSATPARKLETGITHSCSPESFLLSVNPGRPRKFVKHLQICCTGTRTRLPSGAPQPENVDSGRSQSEEVKHIFRFCQNDVSGEFFVN